MKADNLRDALSAGNSERPPSTPPVCAEHGCNKPGVQWGKCWAHAEDGTEIDDSCAPSTAKIGLVRYPLMLRPNCEAAFYLPARLTPRDYARIKAFLHTLILIDDEA